MMGSQLEEGRGDHRFFEQVIGFGRRAWRERVAGWLGCDGDELALTNSTTDGVNTVLAGLALGPGDEVLTSDEEHPGLLAPLAVARRRCGFDAARRAVRRDRRRGRAAHEARGHAATCRGSPARCWTPRRWTRPLLLDGAQGLGAVPVDVRALGCDYYAASGQKWLCGSDRAPATCTCRRERMERAGGHPRRLRLAGRPRPRPRARAPARRRPLPRRGAGPCTTWRGRWPRSTCWRTSAWSACTSAAPSWPALLAQAAGRARAGGGAARALHARVLAGRRSRGRDGAPAGRGASWCASCPARPGCGRPWAPGPTRRRSRPWLRGGRLALRGHDHDAEDDRGGRGEQPERPSPRA